MFEVDKYSISSRTLVATSKEGAQRMVNGRAMALVTRQTAYTVYKNDVEFVEYVVDVTLMGADRDIRFTFPTKPEAQKFFVALCTIARSG